MKKSIAIFTCLFITVQVHAQAELKGSPTDLTQLLAGLPKMVSITGEAEIKVPADRAVMTLKVGTESKSLQESLRLNHELRGKLTEYLKKQGISAERIQASKFSSTPKFGWYGDKAKSYHIDNFIKVTVQDEKEFQAASGAVDAWGEVQYLGLELEHGDKEAMKTEAITKACDKAGERRKLYEEKFGVRLVPKRFSEGMAGLRFPELEMARPVSARKSGDYGKP